MFALNFLIFFFSVLLFPLAESEAFTSFEGGSAEFIVEREASQENTFKAGWLINLEPGWHTYWQNGGDTGLGAQISWRGAQAKELHWPTPHAIPVDPFMSYGYENRVFLGTDIQPIEPTVSSQIDFLICRELCLPITAQASFSVAQSSNDQSTATTNASFLQKIISEQSYPTPHPKFIAQEAYFHGDFIFLPLPSLEKHKSEDLEQQTRFFPAADDLIQDTAPQTILSAPETNQFLLKIRQDEEFIKAQPQNISGLLKTGGDAYSVQFELTAKNIEAEGFLPINQNHTLKKIAGADASPNLNLTALISLMLAAFFAGVILNLMPCVLPVVGLKILSLSNNKQSSIAFTSGILFSFWALAFVVFALQSAGHIVGWGFHLQNLNFVMFLILLLLVLSLSLLGFVQLNLLPNSLQNLTPKPHKPTNDPASSFYNFRGHFINGTLVAVLATPCTAPFMGAAVGVAFSQNLPTMLAIFTSLGLGVSAPYMLFTSVPLTRQFLPKPGAWMVRLKELMSIPLLATVVWLAWVFHSLGGSLEFLIGALTVMAATLWLHRTYPNFCVKILVLLLFALLVIFSPFVPAQFLNFSQFTNSTPQTTEATWKSWTPEIQEALKTQRTPFLVNFTADWCITCKINEHIAFKDDEFAEFVHKRNIQLLKADWTQKNDAITQELAKHGRAGVPLYIYYPAHGNAVILPQILTPNILLNALKGAEKNG